MRRMLITAVVLVLAGCSSTPLPTTLPPAPAPAPAPAPPPPPAPPPVADTCGASKLQHLVGRPRTEIPVPVDPGKQRVACSTCPVTLDFRPDRLNFFFDAQTGLIKEIKCG